MHYSFLELVHVMARIDILVALADIHTRCASWEIAQSDEHHERHPNDPSLLSKANETLDEASLAKKVLNITNSIDKLGKFQHKNITEAKIKSLVEFEVSRKLGSEVLFQAQSRRYLLPSEGCQMFSIECCYFATSQSQASRGSKGHRSTCGTFRQ